MHPARVHVVVGDPLPGFDFAEFDGQVAVEVVVTIGRSQGLHERGAIIVALQLLDVLFQVGQVIGVALVVHQQEHGRLAER